MWPVCEAARSPDTFVESCVANTVHRLTYVLDTSVLLSDPVAFTRFDEHYVVLPVVVITELEAKRNHPELGYFARQALRQLDDLRMSESAAVGVLDDIDLQLPHTAIQLRSERGVAILQGVVFARIVTAGEVFLARRKAEVVAVMRTDYLDLVQVNPGILIGHRLGRQHTCTAEDEQHGDAHTVLQ